MNKKSPNLSEIGKRVPASGTLKMSELARKIEKTGKEVLHLEIGQPNFNTPAEIIEVANEAMIEGKTGYTSSRGIYPLREKIAEVHSKLANTEIDADKNIIVTPGAKAAIFEAMTALVNPDENIITISPYWTSYEGIAKFIGVEFNLVRGFHENFAFPIEYLKEVVNKKTKLLLINSPNNPTGCIYTRDSLEALYDLSEDYDFYILSDEIYKRIVFDNSFTSYLSISKTFERTIIIDGFSKSHAMTGWRIGYALANEELISAMNKIQQNSTTCVNASTQWAAIKALSLDSPVEKMVGAYKLRRDQAIKQIQKSEHLKCIIPSGAFYLFIKYHGKIGSTSLAIKLLEEKGVSVTPGAVFGVKENYLRLSLASSTDHIIDAIKRINDFLSVL